MGLGVFGLSSRDFWSLTMREFWAMHDARFGHLPDPMTKAELQEMMRRNPD